MAQLTQQILRWVEKELALAVAVLALVQIGAGLILHLRVQMTEQALLLF